jgi:prolyl-tRNA synthetase
MNASVDFLGKKEFVKMGSYGIGVSRLVGAIIEAKYDDKNEIMKWPMSVAPYHCAILPILNKNDNSNLIKANNIYKLLKGKNIDTIIDDTDENFSSKMKKFNLLGIPFQITIGKKNEGELIEFREIGKDSQNLKINQIIEIINRKK